MRLLLTSGLEDEDLKILSRYFDEIRIRGLYVRSKILAPEELAAELGDIGVLVVEFDQVTPEVLNAASNLKLIVSLRAGAGRNINLTATTERGIPVACCPGRSSDQVADFTLGVIVALARHIAETHCLIKSRQLTEKNPRREGFAKGDVIWIMNDPRNFSFLRFKGPILAGRTLGILGFGVIGREVARRARGFKVTVIAHDPYVSPEEAAEFGVKLVDCDTLFRESDFLTVHIKDSPETRGLVGRHHFSLMKPTAYFINTARASVIDYNALYEALVNKKIAGAALDVFEEEPLSPDHPLLDLDNVLLTPHIAGASYDSYRVASPLARKAIEDFLADRKPEFLANPEAWEHRRFRIDKDKSDYRKKL